MGAGRITEFNRPRQEEGRKGGIPPCMKPGPDGALSLRDQARQISVSVSDPREAWRLLKDWASKQSDPKAAMHPALWQILRHATDSGFAAIAADIARETGRTSMPSEARENFMQKFGEACSRHSLSFDKTSFTVLTPEGRLLLPASQNGPLPVLAFQPSPTLESPQLGVCPLVPSSDLSQFVMARETIFRVSDDIHRSMTTLERATLMPERESIARLVPPEPPVMSFSKPFERPKVPSISMVPETVKPESPVQPERVSQGFSLPAQSWKDEKAAPRNDFTPSSPSGSVRAQKPLSFQQKTKTNTTRMPVAAEPDLKSPSNMPTTARLAKLPAQSQKTIKPKRRKRKKVKALPINIQKAPKQTRAREAGTGHDLVRVLAEKLKSHAADVQHIHHAGHPKHAKGHVHEAPAKEEKRVVIRRKNKKPKSIEARKTAKERKKANKRKRQNLRKKEKRKVRALLSKKKKKGKGRRS